MNFKDAIQSCFQKYVVFSGRAPRSEYWYFYLFYFLLVLVFSFVGGEAGAMLSGLLALAIFLPFLSVSVRRLHDLDKSGWWILIGLIPIIGPIVLLVWYVSRGTAGPNRFGEDPLGGAAPPAAPEAPAA